MNKPERYKIVLLSLVIVFMAGCSSGPLPKDQALLDAEIAYSKAKSDPAVLEYATPQLQEAKRTLQAATQAEAEEDMASLAYIANVQNQIAVFTAETRKAEKKFEELSNKKNTLVTQALQSEKAALENQLSELSELQAKETARGMMLTLGDVLFVSGKAELQPGAIEPINQLVGFLKQHTEKTIIIEGHTDNTGSSAFNTKLSLKRAEYVQSALLQRGIPAYKITAIGLGQSQPIATNTTEQGRKQNRRVEIIIQH